jgi:pilus assembly protein CpaF
MYDKRINAQIVAVQERVIDSLPAETTEKLTRDEMVAQLTALTLSTIDALYAGSEAHERELLCNMVLDEILGLGPLETLLGDPEVTEIHIDGPDAVRIKRGSSALTTNVRFRDEPHLRGIVDRICASMGQSISVTNPIVDLSMMDGSTFHAELAQGQTTVIIVRNV